MLIISNCSIAETYQGVAFGGGWQNAWRVALSLCCCFGDKFFLAVDHCTGMGPAIPPFLPPPPPPWAIAGTVMLSTISIGRGEKKNEKSCLGGKGSALRYYFCS